MKVTINHKRVISSIILILFVHSTILSQQIGFRISGSRKKVDIPFESLNNLIILDGKIKNNFPIKFILDSGVDHTIITEKSICDLLNIPIDRYIEVPALGTDSLLLFGIASNMSIYFPGTLGTGLSFLVMEDDYLNLRKYLGVNVQGIIGYDLLKNFVVKINYAANYISLIKPKSFKPPGKFVQIPIKIINSKPYIHTDIIFSDEIFMTTMMMIDLGASHSVLFNLSSDDRLTLPDKHISTIVGRGLGGDINGYLARIRSISISDFKLYDVLASFTMEYHTIDTLDPVTHGTIGGEIMNRFTIYLDYANEMMYLKKNYSYKRSFNYNQCGIELTAEGLELNKFVVIRVIDGSPASKTDIREGDILLNLNGTAAEELTLNQIYHIFRKDAGKRIWIKLEREGEIIRKKLQLERII